MTFQEADLLRDALKSLQRLLPDETLGSRELVSTRSPVLKFAKRYLKRNGLLDIATLELWQLYTEIVAAGDLEPLTRQEFERALPGVMDVLFDLQVCHSIERDGQTTDGFKTVTAFDKMQPLLTLQIGSD